MAKSSFRLSQLDLKLSRILQSIVNTYEDSELGFFVFSLDKRILALNNKGNYFIDKYALFSIERFYDQDFVQKGFDKALNCNGSSNFFDENLGLHFFCSVLKSEDDESIGILMQIIEKESTSFLGNNSAPTSENDIENHFLYVLNNLPVMVWLMNPAGSMFWQNETLRKYMNATASEISTGGWVTAMHPDEIAQFNKGISVLLQSREVSRYEFLMKDGNGDYNFFNGSVRPIFDKDDNPIFWLGVNTQQSTDYRKIIRDLEKKLSEKENEHNISLKELKEAEENLFNSQKLETIGNLAGGIAHDFNNLLLMISLSANLMQTKDFDKNHSKELDFILSVIKKGAKLSSQLMTFAGKNPNLPVYINLKKEFEAIELLILKSLTDKVKFVAEIEENLHPIYVDQSYLENSLLNIILNARDALSDISNAQICLTIKNYSVTSSNKSIGLPEGQYIEIKIADNGCGISIENQKKVFDPFFTTKEINKGTGLGLAMVYGFITKCEGKITLESSEDIGTTFTIYLPKAPDLVQSSHENIWAEEYSLKELLESRLRALIVEDNSEVRNSLIDALESKGISCFSSFDAYSAYLYLKSGLEVDIIISDVMMPGVMSALELHDTLRLEGNKIPILYTSGYAENILVKNGEVIDNHHLLMKPYSVDELLVKILGIIGTEY